MFSVEVYKREEISMSDAVLNIYLNNKENTNNKNSEDKDNHNSIHEKLQNKKDKTKVISNINNTFLNKNNYSLLNYNTKRKSNQGKCIK